MDLTGALLRVAAGRPHVLLVELPGSTGVRLGAERELRSRGWPSADSPADTDLFVVTGPIGPRLGPLVDRLWAQVPAPRVRVEVRDAAVVRGALDEARAWLAVGGDPGHAASTEPHQEEGGGPGGRTHAGHGGHGAGMEMPGGLPMADRGADRDGLTLDQLHVPLGPLLPEWPAGLVVHTTLQGDVIQHAGVEVVADEPPAGGFWREPWRRAAAGEPVTVAEAARRRGGAHLDSLGRLLAVAGWADAAARARRLRDDVLDGARAEHLLPRWRRLARRVRGSRTLRRLTGGLGVLPADTAAAAGIVGPLLATSRSGGDVRARWQAWLADIEQALPRTGETGPLPPAGYGFPPGPHGEPTTAVRTVLPDLLEGVELATARLVVASLDPELAELGTATQVRGG